MIADDARVEPHAVVGEGTYVWHLAHVRDGAVIGATCVIGGGVFVDTGVTIGDGCKIQNAAQLFTPTKLGNGVFIGPGAILTNDKTPRAVTPDMDPKAASDWTADGITVGDGASIGAGAIIIAGVTIGAWAMVAAGAVVTHDVLSHELVTGVPARNLGWVGRDGARLESHRDEWVSFDGTRYTMEAGGLMEMPR